MFILCIAPKEEYPPSFKQFNSAINLVIEKVLNEWPNPTTVEKTGMDPNGNEHHCTTRMAFMSLFSNNMTRLLNIMHTMKDDEKIMELEKLKDALEGSNVCYNFLVKYQF
jgi:hypothetical protein